MSHHQPVPDTWGHPAPGSSSLPTVAWWCVLFLQLCAGFIAHFVFTFSLDATPDVASLHTAGAFAFLNASALLAVGGWLALSAGLSRPDRVVRVAAVLAVAGVSISTGIGACRDLDGASIFLASELTRPWTTPFLLLPLVFLNPLLWAMAALPTIFSARGGTHVGPPSRTPVGVRLPTRGRLVSSAVIAGLVITAGIAAGVWPTGEISERVSAIEAERVEAEQRYAAAEPERLEAEREYQAALQEAVETFVPNAEKVAYELLRSGLTPEQMSVRLPELVDDNVRVSSTVVAEDTLDFCLFHEVGRTYVGFRVRVGATEPSYYQCL